MNEQKRLGFGIVGLGNISGMHAKAIMEIEGCTLVGGLDRRQESVDAFANTYGCRGYTDIDAFLADDEIDIVTIATPSGLHLEGALAVAKAKKHLIIEKPIEITKARSQQIIDACTENGVKLMGIFPSRFHDAPQMVKRAIDEGRFGRIVMADAQIKWYRSQAYYDSGAWRGTWELDGGGAMMNQGIHAIDLMQWLAGDVEEVFAFSDTLTHERIEVEDTAVAVLRFVHGGLGVIEATTSAYPGFLKRVEILGSKGSVVIEEESIVKWEFDEEREEDTKIRESFLNTTETGGGAADPMAIGYHGHKRLFESFVNSLRTGSPVEIDGPSSLKAVEIIEAVYMSAKSGKKVKLPI
jgi:UDP-N-acetyl-2-amino-2-deoxyglucuronate dehydrogenase